MSTPRFCVFALLAAATSAVSTFGQTLPTPSAVLDKMRLTNNYFMTKWPDVTKGADATHASNIWTRAVYYEGLLAMYKNVDTDSRYYTYAVDWGTFHKWNTRSGNTTRNADDQCCGQTYIELYQLDPTKTERIANMKICMDNMAASSSNSDWTWIDALQMTMPVFAKMSAVYGDTKYAAKMHAMYLHTKNTYRLYDTTDRLWWRDNAFDPPYTEPNGRDCFWSRGNGWVITALVRTLDVLPTTTAYATYRAEYEQTFKDMCEALRLVQRTDGFWNVSLHDPTNFGGPELTGTALFTQAMAWGVRKGLLSATIYNPVIAKAWNGMATVSVQSNGFLGYSQGTGSKPSDAQPLSATKVPNFEDFGLGCFLLAGTEVYRLVGGLPVGGGSAGGVTGTVYEGETATLSGGTVISSASAGYIGSGYLDFPANGGAATFSNVNGNGGGPKTLSFRFANGGTTARTGTLTVNGVVTSITFPTTGSSTTWQILPVNVTLANTATNSIRLTSTGADLGNVDQLGVPGTPPGNPATYQAEGATLAGGAAVATRFSGFRGTGYVTFPANAGTATFSDVAGNGGGTKNLAIRYTNGGNGASSRTGSITVNGLSQTITFPTTARGAWATLTVSVTLNNNSTNTLRLASTGTGLAGIDELTVP